MAIWSPLPPPPYAEWPYWPHGIDSRTCRCESARGLLRLEQIESAELARRTAEQSERRYLRTMLALAEMALPDPLVLDASLLAWLYVVRFVAATRCRYYQAHSGPTIRTLVEPFRPTGLPAAPATAGTWTAHARPLRRRQHP